MTDKFLVEFGIEPYTPAHKASNMPLDHPGHEINIVKRDLLSEKTDVDSFF